ncbi:hypothetical protein AB0K48_45025 [Nonomuraea sp. NPDC055795]
MREIANELAKILLPAPSIAEGEEHEAYEARRADVRRQRIDLELSLIADGTALASDDPLLAKLLDLTAKKREIQTQIRLIIAYGREFTRPQPYPLRVLAHAADMSISGIRTAYTPVDLQTIASRIRRRDTKGSVILDKPETPLIAMKWGAPSESESSSQESSERRL